MADRGAPAARLRPLAFRGWPLGDLVRASTNGGDTALALSVLCGGQPMSKLTVALPAHLDGPPPPLILPARRSSQRSATPGPARPVRSSLACGSVRYSRPSRDACGGLSGPGAPALCKGRPAGHSGPLAAQGGAMNLNVVLSGRPTADPRRFA